MLKITPRSVSDPAPSEWTSPRARGIRVPAGLVRLSRRSDNNETNKDSYEYDFVCTLSPPHTQRLQPRTQRHGYTATRSTSESSGSRRLRPRTSFLVRFIVWRTRVARRLGRFGFAVLSELPSHSALCTPHSARHCCLTRPQEGKHNPRRACPGQV